MVYQNINKYPFSVNIGSLLKMKMYLYVVSGKCVKSKGRKTSNLWCIDRQSTSCSTAACKRCHVFLFCKNSGGGRLDVRTTKLSKSENITKKIFKFGWGYISMLGFFSINALYHIHASDNQLHMLAS